MILSTRTNLMNYEMTLPPLAIYCVFHLSSIFSNTLINIYIYIIYIYIISVLINKNCRRKDKKNSVDSSEGWRFFSLGGRI